MVDSIKEVLYSTFWKNKIEFLLFRVMEIHRIYEVTATPLNKEGANLSE